MLGGAVWQSLFIGNATGELTASLEKVSEALKEGDAVLALQKANEFNIFWDKEKSTFEALFEHKEVDTISAKARSLPGLCTKDSLPQALSLAEETRFYLEHVHAIDCVSWENIF